MICEKFSHSYNMGECRTQKVSRKSSGEHMSSQKIPTFTRNGNKWLVEYQKDKQDLVIDETQMNHTVYLYKCASSKVTIKGKINSITLDSCQRTSVIFDTLISAIEFINCVSCQMQVLGKVPTVSIDNTDGCQIYLNPNSLDTEIISSKSTEMNVRIPNEIGEYTEYPIPEQFKTTLLGAKGIQTVVNHY